MHFTFGNLMLLMLKLWNCYGICIFGNFVSASLCELFWQMLKFLPPFGLEKNIVCWAFLGTHGR
jgi:hypothetical protein